MLIHAKIYALFVIICMYGLSKILFTIAMKKVIFICVVIIKFEFSHAREIALHMSL